MILSQNKLIKLSGVGGKIFLYADGKHTVNQIIEKIQNERSETIIEEQVMKFLKKMQERGLIMSNWDPLIKLDMPQL